MFGKLNLYTLFTFVVYPVFFIGALLVFIFMYNKKGEASLLKKTDSIRNERPEWRKTPVPADTLNMDDSLSCTRKHFHS